MRWRRRAPAGRQRQRAAAPPSAAPTFLYRQLRSETERDTGRQAQRQALRLKAARTGRFWLQRFGLLVLLMAAVVSLVNILSLSAKANITLLEAGQPGQDFHNQDAYGQASDRYLGNSIWNRSKLTVDTEGLRRQLLKQFPELEAVSVTVPLLSHRLVVHIQPAAPALILVTPDGAYLLAANGRVTAQAGDAAGLGQPDLPVIIDQSGLDLKVDRQALPADDVAFIRTVLAQLAAKKVAVAELTLPAATSEFDVRIAGQPYRVKFNLQTDTPREQVGTYLATIAQLQKQNVTPAQYVDVRVDGRAYYQ